MNCITHQLWYKYHLISCNCSVFANKAITQRSMQREVKGDLCKATKPVIDLLQSMQ